MPDLADLVPIPPGINQGLSACREDTMLDKFGRFGALTDKSSAAKGNVRTRIRYGVVKEQPLMNHWVRVWTSSIWIYYFAKSQSQIIVSLLLLVSACAAPQYDDQTDKLISQLQTDVDTEIVSLITLDHKISNLSGKTDAASQKALADAKSKAGYDGNTAFYDKVDVDLTSLQTRVDAEPSAATPYLDAAIKDLRDNLLTADGSMQATHQKAGILSEAYLRNVQKLVDAQIGALLTREIGLKTGSSGTSSK